MHEMFNVALQSLFLIVILTTNLNTTMNGTQPANCSISGSSKATKIGVTFAYCLILVVSLAGNSLIAIIVYRTKPMQKAINYFIVNMAMSDLLFPVIILPSHIMELHGGFGFFIGHLGQEFCNARLFVVYVSCIASLECLVLIAVDRFVAVVFPLRAPFVSSKLCPFVVLVTWLVSVALSSPVFTIKISCQQLWRDSAVSYYFFTLSIVLCVIFFALILILYSVIVFKLKSQKIPGEESVSAEQKRVKMHRNVLKMVAAIITGFALCWGPYSVISFLNVFVWHTTTSLSCSIILVSFVATFVIHVNCALNPCICFTFSGNYRQGLKGLLGCYGTMQG